MRAGAAAYFILRVRRDGPLVPARIWLCDHDPADASNKLDRGRLSIFPRVDIAGDEVDPDFLQRDRLFSPTDWRPAYGPRHWKYATPITESEYRYQVARRDWAARYHPADPIVQPRQPVSAGSLPLPVFEV